MNDQDNVIQFPEQPGMKQSEPVEPEAADIPAIPDGDPMGLIPPELIGVETPAPQKPDEPQAPPTLRHPSI